LAGGYSRLCELYGPEEAKRCFEIEQHTVSTTVSIIKENGWEKDVDLVEGGRNYLFLSEQELLDRKSDWKRSIEAGIITEDSGQWFTAEETEKVSKLRLAEETSCSDMLIRNTEHLIQFLEYPAITSGL
jgi:hypothetical protein